jgi:hypothetical protein
MEARGRRKLLCSASLLENKLRLSEGYVESFHLLLETEANSPAAIAIARHATRKQRHGKYDLPSSESEGIFRVA